MEIKAEIYSSSNCFSYGRRNPFLICCTAIANDPIRKLLFKQLEDLELSALPTYIYSPDSQSIERIYVGEVKQRRDELIQQINDRIEEIKKHYGF